MSVPRSQATFGGALRKHRLAAGLTQEALADRSGVSPRTIQEVEAGSVQPRRSTAISLAQALNLSEPARDELVQAAVPRPRRRLSGVPSDSPDRRDMPDMLPGPAPPTEHVIRVPALVALPRPAPTNIPWPVSSMIGRESELAAIRDLIAEDRQRLVTLTGLGGSGKTRLVVQVAADLLPAFVDGAWFVELAPTSDPSFVPRVVAAALGVREARDVSIFDALVGFLRRKHLLLVLDNCEHMIDACATVAERLLTACPDVSILATSREPLQIAGEQRRQVRPLDVPDPISAASPEVLAGISSVRLFVERARAIDHDFTLTETNAASVAKICTRLDGIPLAIELAASWMGVLTVEQIAERLDDSFRLLAGGTRAGPTRQRTLEAALGWSYDLLTVTEQATFRFLSTFGGGFTFEAVEAICFHEDVDGPDTLDVLSRLVDKSLVVADQTPHGRRYRLLEPVRQYAHLLLLATGEEEGARTRHASYYAALAERAAPMLRGPEQVAWQARLAREQANLRAALVWAEGRGEVETVARLAVALVPFWEVHGSMREGRLWLDTVLAVTSRLPDEVRTKALIGTGQLAFWQVDLGTAATRFEESLALARELGDRPAAAAAVAWLGATRGAQGAFAAAEPLLEEGLALHEALGDESGAAWVLFNWGRALSNRGAVTKSYVDFERAAPPLEASLRRYRALGEVRFGAIAATHLGALMLRLGERERATALLREGLAGLREVGDHAYLFPSLITLAGVAALTEQPIRAARLLGGAEAVAHALGTTLAPVNRVTQEEVLAAIRPHLDPGALDMARNAGRAMRLDEVVAEAWAFVHDAAAPHRRPRTQRAD